MPNTKKLKIKHRLFKRGTVNRSTSGNIALFLFLLVCGAFTALPLIFAFSTSFKPLDELWLFPPTFVRVNNPTWKNFSDLFVLMQNSWVPMTRYMFNTIFITLTGTLGHIVFASMCAYPLAKREFPGGKQFFSLVVLSLMFNVSVTAIPNYLTMARIGLVDTYYAIIIPAMGAPLGLFLMKQFMSQINNSIIEAAKVDGTSEWRVFWQIVMPQVKPAWLTIMIFSVQSLWNLGASNFIYSEELKTLPYALGQIVSSGLARAGTGAAVTVILMIVPIVIFIFSQSNIIETMSSSGIKE